MSNESPAAILFDESGNPIGIVFDGIVYRLQTQTIVTDGYANGPVAVKPPYTPAESSDPAFVVALSPNNHVTATFTRPALNNTSSVAASTSNTLLLANNPLRLGATFYNDSSSVLYLKLGSGATLTDFTIRIFPVSYYEVPFGYTGEIDGFWVSATGSARIGELVL